MRDKELIRDPKVADSVRSSREILDRNQTLVRELAAIERQLTLGRRR